MKLSDTYGQTIDFEIPEQHTRIGVNCSGGADSAILLYIIADYLKQNNRTDVELNVLSCANDKKHRWNVRKAADVINYTIDKLDWNQFGCHYAYYRDVQAEEYFHEFEMKMFKDDRISFLISGVTATPKIDAVVENSKGVMVDLREHEDCLGNRDPNKQRPLLNVSGHFYTPLTNVDKRFVADMYDHYDVRDMFYLTRSCEAIPDGRYDPDFEQHPCGECWWCLERKWAFGEF